MQDALALASRAAYFDAIATRLQQISAYFPQLLAAAYGYSPINFDAIDTMSAEELLAA